jgi:FtsP/CotA-like multicopper oxidase with cupredoxin domain
MLTAETVPQAALMNDTQNLQIPVQPGKTYFIRIVNMAAFAAQYFWIEGHTFRIIETDGIYHEPTEASMIYITAAQRYGILLTAKNGTDENFAIVGSMDQDLFDTIPDGLNPNVTSFLVYDADKPMPTPALIDEFDPFDDMTLVPTDGEELLEDPDLVVQLDVLMDNLGDGAVSLISSIRKALQNDLLTHGITELRFLQRRDLRPSQSPISIHRPLHRRPSRRPARLWREHKRVHPRRRPDH